MGRSSVPKVGLENGLKGLELGQERGTQNNIFEVIPLTPDMQMDMSLPKQQLMKTPVHGERCQWDRGVELLLKFDGKQQQCPPSNYPHPHPPIYPCLYLACLLLSGYLGTFTACFCVKSCG